MTAAAPPPSPAPPADEHEASRAREARIANLARMRELLADQDRTRSRTRAHAARVADIAVQVGTVMGWPPLRLALLHEAATVHEVGNLAVPSDILDRRRPLTPEQRRRIEVHPSAAAMLLEGALTPEQLSWVRGHHERWDGAGYPDGLERLHIPDGARILAGADRYVTLTTPPPDGDGLVDLDALEVCEDEAASRLDPAVVAALSTIVDLLNGMAAA